MRVLSFFLFFGYAHSMTAQNQLVLIKQDEVQIRYVEGDDFVYKRKSSKQVFKGFLVEINDSTLITSNDTVATHQIERIYFTKGNFFNLIGGFLVFGGSAIFIVDQVNTLLVRGEEASLDSNVSKITLTSLAMGLPMLLLKKQTHRVGFKQRLRIIDKGSPFYYSESRFQKKGYTSPHIPN